MMTCFCLTVGSRLVNISVWHSVCLYPGSCSQWLLRLAVALQCLPWPVCQLSHSCNPIVRLTPLLLFCFDNETGQEITSISSSIFPQKLLQQIFLVRIKKKLGYSPMWSLTLSLWWIACYSFNCGQLLECNASIANFTSVTIAIRCMILLDVSGVFSGNSYG